MNEKTNVLVLGCGGNAGRNFIKCLRASPDVGRIVGTDYNRYYLEACDADVKVLLTGSGHVKDEMAKVLKLREICAREEIGFIHAQPDPEVAFLARHQPEFAGLMVPLDQALLRLAADKGRCQELWSKVLNLKFWACPFVEANRRKFEDLRGADGKVWVRAKNGAGSRGALPVTKFAEAEAWVDFWVNNRGMAAEDFLLAPYLPGPEYAVQTLWWNGELIHCQARERVIHFFATLSPSGQSSTPAVARTVSQPDVVNRAKEAVTILVDAVQPVREPWVKPHGIFCVDLRCDAQGDVIPTEINYGRFFTTMDFFAAMGLNSPAALVRLHAGLPVEPVPPLPADKYWVRGLDQVPVLM